MNSRDMFESTLEAVAGSFRSRTSSSVGATGSCRSMARWSTAAQVSRERPVIPTRVSVTSPRVEVPRSYSSQKRGIFGARRKLKNSMISGSHLRLSRANSTPPRSNTMFFMVAKIVHAAGIYKYRGPTAARREHRGGEERPPGGNESRPGRMPEKKAVHPAGSAGKGLPGKGCRHTGRHTGLRRNQKRWKATVSPAMTMATIDMS